ncbi:MAG TPA: hypothetical protein VGB75_08035 [Jatrophihabitans sp.]|uniref:hypothetical protein n=1 Tax=Jatrophihabitans sp. TaxID=1932789 RepID=UPI002EF7F920
MPSEPDPPSFVVLPEEYDEPSPADHGDTGRARRAGPGWLTGLARHRRARGAAAALACVVAGGFMAVAVTSERSAVRTAAPAAQPPAPASSAVAAPGPWPRAPGACGIQRYLPIVTTAPLRASTGVRIQVGGQSVHTADLDAKSVTAAPGLQLSSGHFVSQLAPGNGLSYALVQGCESTETSSVLRVNTDSSSLVLASDRHIETLLTDGRNGVVWAVQVADIATDEPITLVQLPGPGVVRLPVGLSPVAVWGNQLIALATTAGERRSPSSGTLVRYDLSTRRMGPRIGRASSLTADAGMLLWIDQPCSLVAACAVHSYDLATGALRVREYTLPVETSLTGGAISPDGARVAFALERVYEGQRVDADGFGPPSDVAVLNLDTGALEKVGGVKLPATEKAGLTFSSRGDWLVIALNQRHGAEVLVWRQGQTRALRSGVRIPDQMLEAPPVLALSS